MTAPRPWAGYVLDLDGTVYLGERLIPGADTAIERVRAAGARVVFVTNKPLHTAEEYAAKLTALGIPTTASDVVTAVDALVRYLATHHPGRRLLTISEELVRERLLAAGFTLSDEPERSEVVVVAFDRTFSYEKLHAGYRAVRENGAAIVATNPDPYCPTPDGGLPDCAAMLAALEACTGARAEAIVGKPSRHMAETFLERLHLDPAEVAVVGDRLSTDVAMGKAIGAAAILVLTGATDAASIAGSPVQPDLVLDSLQDLHSQQPAGAIT